jgi:hypothetical protein
MKFVEKLLELAQKIWTGEALFLSRRLFILPMSNCTISFALYYHTGSHSLRFYVSPYQLGQGTVAQTKGEEYKFSYVMPCNRVEIYYYMLFCMELDCADLFFDYEYSSGAFPRNQTGRHPVPRDSIFFIVILWRLKTRSEWQENRKDCTLKSFLC